MNEFVAACRREWQRLRVPDAVADEMAAELEADLDEASAEGFSAEDVLGATAADPRSFAAAWAAERGVERPSRRWARRLILAAIVVLVVVAVTGSALAIFASPAGSESASAFIPRGSGQLVTVAAPAPAPSGDGAVWVTTTSTDLRDSDGHTREIGLTLLTAGAAGLVLLTLFGLWLAPARGRLSAA